MISDISLLRYHCTRCKDLQLQNLVQLTIGAHCFSTLHIDTVFVLIYTVFMLIYTVFILINIVFILIYTAFILIYTAFMQIYTVCVHI